MPLKAIIENFGLIIVKHFTTNGYYNNIYENIN